MKTFVGILITLLLCAAGVAAQETVVNREVLFTAPKAEELKEFTPKDKKFTIVFAGQPEAKEDEKNQLGSTSTYYTQAKFSDQQLKVTVANGPFEKKGVFEHYRKTLTGLPSAKLTEKEVKVGKETGVEFDVTYVSNTLRSMRMRFVVMGNRMYEFKSSMVNWELATDAEKQAFGEESTRFFDSFKLGK